MAWQERFGGDLNDIEAHKRSTVEQAFMLADEEDACSWK